MNRWLRQYWQERLVAGRIFAFPRHAKKGYDYRCPEGEEYWPALVAKDALYKDYLLWAEKRGTQPVPMSDMYRQLEPLLYPYGKHAQTRRSNVSKHVYAGGRMIQGRVMRAFLKMPPLWVMQAHYNLVSMRGTMVERAEWHRIVNAEAEAFNVSVARVPQI